jgi:hypothetical protein
VISSDPNPNGRVYQWVSPDPITGDKKGNFAPIIPLPAPQQKQMLTAGSEFQWNKNGRVFVELGLNRHDLNRYSDLDDDNNIGAAVKVNISDAFLGKIMDISASCIVMKAVV